MYRNTDKRLEVKPLNQPCGNYRTVRGGYTTLSNTRLGPLRLVIDSDIRYWTVGITVGTGWYFRLDVGPVGISVMKTSERTDRQ